METIRVLQIGTTDWRGIYTIPEIAAWDFCETVETLPKRAYDLVFLTRPVGRAEKELLLKAVLPYTLFLCGGADMDDATRDLAEKKKAEILSDGQIQRFLSEELRFFFHTPYGERFRHENLAVAEDFHGDVRWHGGCYLQLDGDYGQEMNQVAFWRNNIPLNKGQSLEFWLEYEKDPDVEIALQIMHFIGGGSEVLQKWTFGEEELKDVVCIDNPIVNGNIFLSIYAKGKGRLRIRNLHDRHSRKGHGYFLPGGERYVTPEREELFCYFDPGDRKPPLSVYFSGYRQQEGFEGRNMMRRMGCPFLLITDPRMEGGNFYMGSAQYEALMVATIRRYMEELHFTPEQLILSGISMGSVGSLYYGSELQPHALILGKPLCNLGDIAANERLVRPGVFPTSLDVMMNVCGTSDADAVERFNRRFWDKFDSADWSGTKIILSYLIEDDYDGSAYQTLLSHVQSGGAQVYGKGIHGRHCDNTEYVVEWFTSQYRKILREDFGREL